MTTNGIISARPTAYNLVDPRSIARKPGANKRFDFGEINELAKSIKVQATQFDVPGGLLNALRIQPVAKDDNVPEGQHFWLIDGDRRLTAIEHLLALHAKGSPDGYDFPRGVPTFSVPKDQSRLANIAQMFEANTAKPLLPLEEAAFFKEMRDEGLTLAEICAIVGRSAIHVGTTLALLEADDTVQDAVKTGKVSAQAAKAIASTAKGDKGAQQDMLADAVAAKGKTPDAKAAKARLSKKLQAAKVAKAAAKGQTLKMRALTDDQLSEMGARLAKHLGALLKEAKLGEDITQDGLQKWAALDDKLAVAYTAGVVDALKAAAGMAINLEV